MKRLILLDTHAIIHRAYHALPPLTTPAGEPVNAVYGFISILLRILRELSPDYIAAASDVPGPTFRHEVSETYKAQRPEAAEDLVSQFAKIKEALAALGIAVFEKEGYEADDIIGTIAEKFKKNKDVGIIVVTGDADELQLVRPRLTVYMMKKGITESVMYDEAGVRERYGLRPDQIVDFKALKGDPSDNITGVRGIGEKTATELLQRFGTVEGIYRAIAKKDKRVSPAVVEKLKAGRQDARTSRTLAAIATRVPLAIALDDLRWQGGDALLVRARPLLEQWGFTSLIRRLAGGESGSGSASPRGKKQNPKGAQASLLGDAPEGQSPDGALRAMLAVAGSSPLGMLMADQETLVLVNNNGEVAAATKDALRSPAVRAALARHPASVPLGTSSLTGLAAHDAKSVIKFLRFCGIAPKDFSFDTMLAGYVLESSLPDFSYAATAARVLGAGDPAENVGRFFDVVERLRKKIAEEKLAKVFYEIEMPLVRILADMEEQGVLIDRGSLTGLARDAEKRIGALTRTIYALAGEEFNINSSQQLSRVLFDVLKIPARGLRKTEKGGVISTRESELEKLRSGNPIIEHILDYREMTKIKSTYIDALPALADPKTERIHTTFNQTGTSTGRLSSSNPNLQNIPILSEFGRKIRNAFAASPGFHLVSFDYSQIELRVAAHLANDAKMIDAFRRGVDIHKLTASEVYNVSLDKVTPELRRQAKTLNFGVLYGMGANAFAEATGMDRDEAKRFIDEYFRDFSGIYAYVEAVKEFARTHGYVETLFGRRRYIPEILSGGLRARRDAERMAVNMPVQGTGTGDIVKLAMIAADRWIRDNHHQDRVRLLLQVHDELLFEVKKNFVEEAAREIKRIMETVIALRVPLVVDVKAGPNWGEQKPITNNQ